MRRKAIFALVVLSISWSNIWWPWADAYLACSLAIISGFAFDAVYVVAYYKVLAWRQERAALSKGATTRQT